MRVWVDDQRCRGHGMCLTLCPDVFSLTDDGYAEAIDSDGTRVALKLVKADYARDETFRRRFHREARIAQTVKHPNVVPVIATGEQHSVREFVELTAKFLDMEIRWEGNSDLFPHIYGPLNVDAVTRFKNIW